MQTPKAIWIYFSSIFKANLPPTWLQLGSENPPKSLKNRCQDAFHLGRRFLIDFWSIFAPNFDPRNLKNSELTSIFGPILVPTWLHFGTKNPPKSVQKSTPRGIDFSIDFCIHFLTIFGRLGLHLGAQVGAMLATFSAQDGSQDASKISSHFDLRTGAPGTLFWEAWRNARGSGEEKGGGHRSCI